MWKGFWEEVVMRLWHEGRSLRFLRFDGSSLLSPRRIRKERSLWLEGDSPLALDSCSSATGTNEWSLGWSRLGRLPHACDSTFDCSNNTSSHGV